MHFFTFSTSFFHLINATNIGTLATIHSQTRTWICEQTECLGKCLVFSTKEMFVTTSLAAP